MHFKLMGFGLPAGRRLEIGANAPAAASKDSDIPEVFAAISKVNLELEDVEEQEDPEMFLSLSSESLSEVRV